VVDMVIRPTNVLDPEIEICPREGQLAKLLEAASDAVAHGDRVLVMALTKRDAEDVAGWLCDQGLRAQYIHSELNTVERAGVLQGLQKGKCDVLVGVNLLREGLDLPQVSLVVVLDADKEGFLRSERSLIQGIGRAARNQRGRAIFFADRVTGAMTKCIRETYRRRDRQQAYNERHELQPRSAKGSATKSLFDMERESLQTELESIRNEIAPFRKGRRAGTSGGDASEAGDRGGEDGIAREAVGVMEFAAAEGELVADLEALTLQAGEAVGSGAAEEARMQVEDAMAVAAAGVEWDRRGGEVGGGEDLARLRQLAAKLPAAPGVYLWREAGGEGCAVAVHAASNGVDAASNGVGAASNGVWGGVRVGSDADGFSEKSVSGWGEGGGGGDVLYVGKAKNLRKRVLSYFSGAAGGGAKGSPRIRAMMARAESIEFVVTPAGEHDALLLEARLIKRLQPRYNVSRCVTLNVTPEGRWVTSVCDAGAPQG